MTNILMRVDTKNGTEELKEKFEKQIQDIEEESSKKQEESKSVEEMIIEQPDLLNDVHSFRIIIMLLLRSFIRNHRLHNTLVM